jgi:hypothetical protein
MPDLICESLSISGLARTYKLLQSKHRDISKWHATPYTSKLWGPTYAVKG